MDTNAYNRCGVMSQDALRSMVQKIKAHSAPNGSSKSTSSKAASQAVEFERKIDMLATMYRERLKRLCTEIDIHDIANPSASVAFYAFLQNISETHRQFKEQALLGRTFEHGKYVVAISKAWGALIYECFDQKISEWLQVWIHLVLCAIVHLEKCIPPLEPCTDNGLDQAVAARLEQYHNATGLHVLGISAVSCDNPEIITSFDGFDDEDPQIDMLERRRRKFYRHMSRDSRTACVFLNDCASTCRILVELGVPKYTRRWFLSAIDRIVQSTVKLSELQWEEPCLEKMLFGIRLATATFDALLVQPDGSFQDIGTLVEYAERGVLKQFAELRIAELFSIIIDYPDSKAAIDDLRMCVAKLGNMRHMANLLRNAIQKRLLHPGATTNDILTQYISSIRCLRLLDPSSTVLEIVAQPIREYLRSREDTVSCIVQDMVSEESELFEDLASGQGLIMENGPDGIVYDEEYANKNWEPLPIEAKNVFVTAQRRDADVLSLLVSIYDTKDVFVHEFEKYLEQQLLYCTEYNTEREIKQVEMMKLRFGDHALERCEVMLKDIADSKRIAQYVDETSKSKLWDMPMQATIVSRQFWAGAPKEEEYKDPKEMAEICERYASVYEMLKPARKLEWRGSQSQISLSIELADRTLEVTVKPAQAAVLFTFQEYGTQTLADIAKSLGCTEDFALSRIRFWQARGIVRETESNTFEVIENENKSNIGVGAEKTGGHDSGESAQESNLHKNTDEGGSKDDRIHDTDEDDDDENGESAAEASTARTEILRMNFKYIVGMLTNLGPLPLDRILSMLSMFVPGESTTPDELRDFLAQMVREDQLEMTGGMYKLK